MVIKDKLLNPYYIVIEDNCYVVSKDAKGQGVYKGQTVAKSLSWCDSFDRAVRNILQRKNAAESTVVSLEEFLDKYKKLKEEIDAAVRI